MCLPQAPLNDTKSGHTLAGCSETQILWNVRVSGLLRVVPGPSRIRASRIDVHFRDIVRWIRLVFGERLMLLATLLRAYVC